MPVGIYRFSDRNEVGLASIFSLAIIRILHVTILHLFSTISSQRLVDGTSVEQRTKDPPTSPSGVTSENPEVPEGTTRKRCMYDS